MEAACKTSASSAQVGALASFCSKAQAERGRHDNTAELLCSVWRCLPSWCERHGHSRAWTTAFAPHPDGAAAAFFIVSVWLSIPVLFICCVCTLCCCNTQQHTAAHALPVAVHAQQVPHMYRGVHGSAACRDMNTPCSPILQNQSAG